MDLQKLSMHEAYKNFCSKHPLKKLSMPKSDLVWSYYDINSRNDNVVIFLHGICGTAGCYFYQLEVLANLGFRVISFQYPCYNYLKDWIKNMCNILEYLGIKKAHFFASDLGGYLIQLYAKLYPSKIESLILCNTYRRTDDFAAVASFRNIYGKLYSFLPHVLLKKIILENYIYGDYGYIDLKEKNSLEFMSNEIDLINASDLGGRISLQLSSEIVDGIYINDKCITILQTVNNTYADNLNEDMKRAYPGAKHAIMKSGGSFPYLSRYEEVNIYLLVHLRNNCNSAFVKEQISSMGYIHQQKSEDVDIDQFLERKTHFNPSGGKYIRKNQSSEKGGTVNRGILTSSGNASNSRTAGNVDGSASKSCSGNSNQSCHGSNNDNVIYTYKERSESDRQNNIEKTNKNKYDNTYEKDNFNSNIYKHDSFNSYECFSRKDTVTSDETVNSNENGNSYAYNACLNADRKNCDIRNGKYNGIDSVGEKSHGRGSGSGMYKHAPMGGRSHSKQNLYGREHDKEGSKENSFISDKLANSPNIFNINHNDGDFINSYRSNRNTTYEEDTYSHINNEHAYASNENDKATGRDIPSSEECYNESLDYQDDFTENDPTYNHANPKRDKNGKPHEQDIIVSFVHCPKRDKNGKPHEQDIIVSFVHCYKFSTFFSSEKTLS
ncbi:acid cluster protein 33 homologue, putative [Plasmodium ovale curtisi]|uniref:Maspardin n=1 Tax=Plasmodium ovale curtisi TaxID=864141 RepID=A0A1A8W1N2_PLAOA|nr:acid cluster protein 33 homologue, putative [Plasmodium ovale curtisi]